MHQQSLNRRTRARIGLAFIALFLVGLFQANASFAVTVQPSAAPAASAAAPAADKVTFWAIMREKANLKGTQAQSNWVSRGQAVVAQLQAAASSSQSSLRALLKGRGIAHQSFWIVNALRITADKSVMQEVAARQDVERVVADGVYSIPEPEPVKSGARVQGVEWNVAHIRASDAWAAFGAMGDGIVVANIDTGVQYDHPALVRQYRGNVGSGAFDHNYNWYDPSQVCGSPSLVPCDNIEHGTHTMGTMVGDDGGANQIGVAPGAKWIAVKGCETNGCSTGALLAAGQWLLAPTDLTGANPRPDLRPHVVNNSWGGGSGDPFYEAIVNAWVASGIFPAFSNGNSGPSCASSGSPGDYAASYSSGAFDIDNNIAEFSSRGPGIGGVVKPNIAAPGVNVRSSVPGNSYGSFSGTSMASPHTAATVALMWSVAPTLVGDIAGTRSLLDQSALDTTDTSCGGTDTNNNVWGEGRLDAYAAVDLAPRGPVGTLQGTVTKAVDATPVIGARVRAMGPALRAATTGSTGNYGMTLPAGDYDVTVSAFGFSAETVTSVSVVDGAITEQDIALTPAPSYKVSGYVRDETGAGVANATVTIVDTPIAPTMTNAAGYYAFPAVPEGSYDMVAANGACNMPHNQSVAIGGDTSVDFVVALRQDSYGYSCRPDTFSYIEANTVLGLSGDDAAAPVSLPFPFVFYGQVFETAYVSTNGMLNFLAADFSYLNEALPSATPPNAAIYPFWDDLYVDAASSVRTELLGTAPNRRFVIEWRDVALCCVGSERVSFEVVLFEDGRILMQYASIDADDRERGASASIGVENETGSVALQYAFGKAVLSDGLAVLYTGPSIGFVQGKVTDAIDGAGRVGAVVRALQGGTPRAEVTTGAGGVYRLVLPTGSYTLEASAVNYLTARSNISLAAGARLTRNFALNSARAKVTPSVLKFVAVPGRTVSSTLVLRNTGRADLSYTVGELPVASATRAPAALQQGVTANKAPAGYKPITVSAAFTGAEVLLLMDALPWGSDALQRVLSSNGIAFDTATSREMGNIDLSRYKTVIIASDQPLSFYVNYSSNRARFTEFVDAGGLLWFGAAAWGWNGGSLDGEKLPGGVTVRGLISEANNDMLDETHPAMQGVPNPFSGAPASHAVFANLPAGAKTIVRGSNSGLPTLVEYALGSGRVLALGQTLEFGFQYGEASGRILENGIPYAYNFDPTQDLPWLSANPLTGTLAPGAQQSIRVSVNTAGLKPGLYRARVLLHSNDPTNGRLLVPVTLVVPAYEKAVNAGGGDYTDRQQLRWLGDRQYRSGGWGYVNSSTPVSTTRGIGGTQDDPLYQKQRRGVLEYRFDNVPRGVYEIDLRFAELKDQQPNRRLFHVLVEGDIKIFAHDTALDAGSFAADKHTLFVKVTDGQLNVRFLPLPGSEPTIVNGLRVTHRPDR